MFLSIKTTELKILKVNITLFDSGSASSLLRNLLKESSSDSPNSVIGSPRSLNLRMTSFLDNVCLPEVVLLLSSPLPNKQDIK